MSVVARARVEEDDVIAGLRSFPKRLPCRLLYDHTGAELFEQITGLDEYYPTRCELRLLDHHLPEIAAKIGVMARVIEPGAGAGIKTRRLLRALDEPASYVGIDVSQQMLESTARRMRDEFPTVDVQTLAQDFTRPFRLPPPRRPIGRTLVFFPGSTIGNFEPHEAVAFLSGLARASGDKGRLLIGADGTRDRAALLAAYDDREGVTARFEKNVLAHLNRTRDAELDPETFRYRAVWNEQRSRVEMHLVSKQAQRVRIGTEVIELAAGEPIITEHAYKHTLHAMRGILMAAGWYPVAVHEHAEQPMRLWLCENAGTRAAKPASL